MYPQDYDVAWVLSSPDHHEIATSFFDEIYDQYHPAYSNATYSTGRVARHKVAVASKGPDPAPQSTGDLVDDLLRDFLFVRAGYLYLF